MKLRKQVLGVMLSKMYSDSPELPQVGLKTKISCIGCHMYTNCAAKCLTDTVSSIKHRTHKLALGKFSQPQLSDSFVAFKNIEF